MSRWWVLAVAAASFAAYAAPSRVTVRIVRDMHGLHPSVAEMILSQEGKKFYCKTPDVPEHEVRLPGLKDLSPPFKSEDSSGCGSTVSWGARRACYVQGQWPAVDRLLASCPSI